MPNNALVSQAAEQTDTISQIDDWTQFERTLQSLNGAYKRTKFDSLEETANQLNLFLANQKKNSTKSWEENRETPDFWKAMTLIYELNDMFHLADGVQINQDALTQGQFVYDQLRKLSWKATVENISLSERLLARDQVMYCACRGNELRRRGSPELAAELFEWLLDFTSKTLQTPDYPCRETRARLTYHLGIVYRVLERHRLAEDKFTDTLNLLWEKMGVEDTDRLFLIRRQAMAVGIGYGWVSLTKGSLRRAEIALTTARSLLAGIKDPVVPPFIELLYGTIRRCQAGKDPGKLGEAVKSLEEALTKLNKLHHVPHVARAHFELALALNLLGKFEEAEKHLSYVEDRADKIGHAKWQTSVLVVRSRLCRNDRNYEEALEYAKAAVSKAEDSKSVLALTDAYITRGEAMLASLEARKATSYGAARMDFELALNKIGAFRPKQKDPLLPSNPKIVAVCELRVAQCFARDGNEKDARVHFATWELLRSSVEHEWVRELGEEVKQEIEALSMNFVISARDHNEWDYARNVSQLRAWLLTQALRYTKRNYSAAAKLIGVKRGTLYQWQDDSRSQPKRARAKTQAEM